MKKSRLSEDLNLGVWISLAFVVFFLASIVFYPAFAGVTLLLVFGCVVMTFLIGIGDDYNTSEIVFMFGGSITLYSLCVAVLHALRWTGYIQVDMDWVTLSIIAGTSLGIISIILFIVQKINN